jgi:SAM-dependent methyltransferase
MNITFDARAVYQGIEDPGNFRTAADLHAYRARCLDKSQPQAEFISRQGWPAGKALEIGCGNGRLLFVLAQRDLITTGMGIDAAESRITFARNWCTDLGLDSRIRFVVGDVLQLPEYDGDHRLILCITSAFGYFYGLEPDGDAKVLQWMLARCTNDAHFVFELYRYPEELEACRQANGEWVRLWNELPPDDPFRFFLHERRWDEEKRLLYHRKYFIHRSGWIDDSRGGECQRIYTPEEFADLLAGAGLKVTGMYGDWTGAEVTPDDEMLIVTAARRA